MCQQDMTHYFIRKDLHANANIDSYLLMPSSTHLKNCIHDHAAKIPLGTNMAAAETKTITP